MQITSKVWNTNQFAAHLLIIIFNAHTPQANPKVRWIFWAIGAKASERNLRKKKKETKFQMPKPDNNSAK